MRRLLAAQFPRWAELPIERVESAGTENALYRLGDDRVVRLPLLRRPIAEIEKEHRWLPKLAPHLPLAIPEPLALGEPAEGYPCHWSVYRWLEGEKATLERIADLREAARTLARFVLALQRIDTTGGPRPGRHNFYRGVDLALRDPITRNSIAALDGMVDTAAVTAEWEAALAIPAWPREPVWIHGDIQSGNLLTVSGRLSAVIDFGGLGVGDPAVDLIVAWNLLPAEARAVFRAELGVDDATWARGRGWALSVSLVALPYYQTTNPVHAALSRHAIAELLADRGRGA
ncbi:MAG: aminoglycoside phosphotransferase family protein [Myxococcota bacterium]